MAAGKGTRMRSSLPKVLNLVLDRPMIDCLASSVLEAGLGDLAVLVGAGGDEVNKFLADKFGSRVKVLWQPEQRGTGDAVKCSADWWRAYDELIVLNGDIPLVTAGSLIKLANSFSAGGAEAAVVTFIARDPKGYGRVVRDDANQRVKIIEHCDADASQRKIKEVNAGCYAFKTPALVKALAQIDTQNAQGEYYLPDVLNFMTSAAITLPEREFSGVNTQFELSLANAYMRERVNKYWQNRGVRMLDINSVWISAYAELAPDVLIMPNVQIWGHSKIGEGSYIGSGSILRDATLGERVELVANVIIENSELKSDAKAGPFVYIRDGSCLEAHAFAGKFVELKKTHVGENSKVPHLSYLGDATLGHNVNIGAGTITCNYDGVNKHATTIGDNCFVGSDTMFVAPAVMGDDAATAAGSVITSEVPAGALGVGRARQKNIAGWAARKRVKS